MARRAIAYLHPDPAEREALRSAPPGVEIVDIVVEAGGVGDEAPMAAAGAREVLARIAAGEASALLVSRLGGVARSPRELLTLIEWLELAGADLLALDVGLDSGAAAGRRSVALIRELDRLEREVALRRAPRGRPGLATRAPDLAERIARLRAEGLTLQGIADALNREGVATQRGGAQWRPSSVQAALGYRRPRPGTPPPPPPRSGPARPHPGLGRSAEPPRPPHGRPPA